MPLHKKSRKTDKKNLHEQQKSNEQRNTIQRNEDEQTVK